MKKYIVLILISCLLATPAFAARLLFSGNATSIQGRGIASTAPTADQVLKWNAITSMWEPGAGAGATTFLGLTDTPSVYTAHGGEYVKVNDGATALEFTASTVAGHTILDSTIHTDALTGTVLRGDVIIGNSTPKWSRLGKGTSGAILTVNTTDALWSTYFLSGTTGQTYTFPTTSKTVAASDGSNLTIAGQAIGDILIASSTTAYGKLPDVVAGQPLLSGGVGAPPAYAGYTFSGTAATIYTFPGTTATLARTDAGQTFTGVNVFTSPTITTAIAATTAGGATLGTGPLPFSSVYIGGAATNNIQLTGTSAAARIVNIPDIATTGYIPLLSATSTTAGQVPLSTTTAGKETYSTGVLSLGVNLTVQTGAVTLTGDSGGSTLILPAGSNTLGTAAFTAATAYQAADAELAAIAGLTFADASIIQLTGAAAVATLTSGGNNYFLKSTSDNSAIEFATPANALTAIGGAPAAGSSSIVTVGALTAGSLATGFTVVTVPLGGTGASTYALNGVLYGNAANAIGVTAIGGEGQLLRVGADPFVPAWTTATWPGTVADGSVLATNAANIMSAITWHSAGTKVLTNASGTISWEDAAAPGAHDLVGASHTLSGGTAGKIVIATDATTIEWSTPTFANTYAKGTVLHAGTAEIITGLAPGAIGSFLMSNGTGEALTYLAAGADGYILVGGGVTTVPTWTASTGSGAPARAGSPTFTTQITTPKVTNAGNITIDAVNAAANSTVAIGNSAATYVANVTIDGDTTISGLLKTGTGPTTLTDAAGKILAASLNTVGVPQGGTGLTTVAAGSYLKGNDANALVPRTYSEVKTDLSLNLVENTALTTWTGAATIATVGTITSGVWNGTAITVPKGGTGITSGTSGGIPYYSGTTTMATSALLAQYGVVIGGGAGTTPATITPATTTTYALFATATAPAFRAIALGDLPNITVPTGGTGLTSGTSGGIPYFSATNAMTSSALLAQYGVMIGGGAGVAPSTITASTTTTYALFATATSPAFRALAVGDLPTVTVAYGGTGITAGTQYGLPYFTTTGLMASTAAGTTTTLLHGNAAGAPTWGAVSLTADVSGTLPVANGGTNKASWTLYAVPYASGTTTIGEVTIGTAGQYLKVNSEATGYDWGTPSGAGDLKADGTVPLTANWNVGAFTITAAGFIAAKSSGVAGEAQLYNDYLTETFGVIFKGPTGTMASAYTLQYPNAAPTTGQVAVYGTPMTWLTPAPLASPGLTGTPTAPTAAADTNTTQIATTAFVVGQAGTASPNMDSSATVGTSLRYSRQDHIHPSNTLKANVASPTFTGTVTLPTGGTSAAPLKFVSGSLLSTPVAGTMEFLTDAAYFTISTGPARKTFAFLDSNITGTAANLSGTPALPNGTTATTQSQADNSTKLATTAYVDTGLGGKQASDATLTAFAGLTIADVSIVEGTGADAFNIVTSGGNNYILGSNSNNTALEFKTPANVLSQIGAQTSDAELTAIAGLTFADVSIIELTGANAAAVVTSGGANRLLGSNSDNTALEFKSSISISELNLPSTDADPGTTAGQIRHDSTVTGLTGGAVKWYNGTAVKILVDVLATDFGTGPTDTYVVAYDAGNDKHYYKADANTGIWGSITGTLSAQTDLQSALGGKAAVAQTMYIGTTGVAINRESAALTLAGITLTTPNIGAATGTSLLATGIVDGLANVVVVTSTPVTVGGTGKLSAYYFNQHATPATAMVYNLPVASAGQQFCFKNSHGAGGANTGTIRIHPVTNSYMTIAGTNCTISYDLLTSANAAGDYVCITGVDATHWEVMGNKATCACAAPL